MDVFVCCSITDDRRFDMARRVVERWLSLKVEPIILHRKGTRIAKEWIDLPVVMVDVDAKDFQRQRRMITDAVSTTGIYVCADDDCLPLDNLNGLRQAETILRQHSDFAILSALPSKANIVPWTPESYQPFEDQYVMEHVSVGGIRFCRKGALKEWPPHDGNAGFDREHCAAIRAAGKRVGYFRSHVMEHLGEGHSTVWN